MRQKGDPLLTSILRRLRKGTCTEDDKAILDKHVLSDAECSESTRNLTDINRWIDDPVHACPLIVYTELPAIDTLRNKLESLVDAFMQVMTLHNTSTPLDTFLDPAKLTATVQAMSPSTGHHTQIAICGFQLTRRMVIWANHQ
ncbi:hypothetical protein B0H13DRAFT_2353553 [Mycena leptocephala]|nr:hypothetical protein B0H13DRAFT_2353553 [Mycena leptocephala]